MKKHILLFIIFNVLYYFSYSQCPQTSFIFDSNGCTKQDITLNNTSIGADTFYWDFCPGDFSTIPILQNGSISLSNPLGITPVYDGVNWYVFINNDGTNSITRLDYGSSLDNTPTATDLGNIGSEISSPCRSNLVMYKEGGNWYGLLPCQGNSKLIKYNFGTSLTNTPTATSTVFSQFSGSAFICQLINDNSNLYLFVANTSGTIEVLNFGNSINNSPVASTIAVPGSSVLLCIDIVKYCDEWIGFTTNYGNSSIIRLNFGNSLGNNPSTALLTPLNNTISNPQTIKLAHDGLTWNAFVQNANGSISHLNFDNNLGSISPSCSNLNLSGYNSSGFSLGMAESSSKFHLFTTNYGGNSFGKIKFEKFCGEDSSNSLLTNPIVTFNQPGLKLITLTAADSIGNFSFFTDSILVNSSPETNFEASNRCMNSQTLLNDISTIVSGAIISYSWDFDDGSTSILEDPIHSFQDTGLYHVKLLTQAATGCVDSLTKAIHISPTPVANFLATLGCSDYPIQFTDSSFISSGSIQSWVWEFGNGDSSVDQNPGYIYDDGGTYTVVLSVISDSGCASNDSSLILINDSPDGAFSVSNTCVGQTSQFANETISLSPIVSNIWNFGDGDSSSATNPSHIYSASVATYPVTLIMVSANGCVDTVLQNIKINNIPSASFGFSPANACEKNLVSFNDLSSVTGDTLIRWLWNFGDGFSDTLQNPIHVFDTAGIYTVSLNVYSPTNCGSSTSQNVTVIESPVADFSYTPVCIGSQTVFSDLSSAPTGNLVTGYHWDFGDEDTSDNQNPFHTYAAAGNYLVTLSIETNFGCIDQDTMTVVVYPQPIAGFTHGNACSIYPVSFTSSSTAVPPYTISSYLWNFGDPASGPNNISSLPTPSHSFADTGIYVVSLIAVSDVGCADTAFDVITVLQSSIPNFQYSPTCYGDLVEFTNLTTPPSLDTAWLWNFGDGQTTVLENPAHFYAFPGNYLVTLTVAAKNGCVSFASKPVSVSPIPIANFAVTPICVNTPYQFIDQSSISSGSIVSWKWLITNFDSSSLQNPYFTFQDTGTYSVILTVTSDIGCTKSITKSVTVYPLPVANFQFTPQYGNPPLNVMFTNLSSGASTYQWSFGDGGQSTLLNPTHTYQDTGNFPIRLISQSIHGCIDTTNKSIYVIKPLIDIAVNNISHTIQNNYLFISAEVTNLGTRDIQNFKITAEIEDGSRIQETYNGFLPNGSSGVMLYHFNAAFELPKGKDVNYYCVSVSSPNGENDEVPGNDKKCNSLDNKFFFKDPYPNPFIGELTIELILPYSGEHSISLFDQSGKLVRQIVDGTGNKGLNIYSINLPFLSEGIYTLRSMFADETVVKQVVKVIPKK